MCMKGKHMNISARIMKNKIGMKEYDKGVLVWMFCRFNGEKYDHISKPLVTPEQSSCS